MSQEPDASESSTSRWQFSLWTLLKVATYFAVAIYFVWQSWDHLGFTLILFVLLSPFLFFAEIVDWILGIKRR